MKSRYALLLMLPALFILAFVFIIPLFFLIAKSFQHFVPGTLFSPPGFTIENYVELISDPYYWSVYFRTLRISIISTLIILVVSYPLSIFLAKRSDKVRGFFLTLVILPMIGGAMIQTMGWFATLMRYGLFNSVLLELGIIERSINFLGTELGVIIGLVQAFLPMMVYPLTSSLLQIDKDVIDASKTLGAGRWTIFFRFTLPLTIPGVVAGSVLVFMACLTSFVTPSSLGQGKIQVFGTYAYQQAMQVMNWPHSSAFSIFFILLIGIATYLVGVAMKRLNRRSGL